MQQDVLSLHAELMTFIGFTGGVKGWKFMRNTNIIFHATKAVFDENMYPQCPDGSHVNIPAIETGVLPPLDSYLDRDNNIPPEDGDQPPPPLPAEIDPIWRHQGYSWPYLPEADDGSGGIDSQPPSQPPSPGLSYCTPRTPSSRHRSVTPSHHSSGNTDSRHTSSGSTSARSWTLTELGVPTSEQEISRTQPKLRNDGSSARWKYEITMGDGTIRHRSVSPNTCNKLWILMAGTEGTIAGHCPSLPSTVSRVMARCQLMESPLAPRSTAIPQHEIASYPPEWREGARSGKYSFIPSYQGWRRGDLPEFVQTN